MVSGAFLLRTCLLPAAGMQTRPRGDTHLCGITLYWCCSGGRAYILQYLGVSLLGSIDEENLVDLWFQPYCSSQNQGVLQRQKGPDMGVAGLIRYHKTEDITSKACFTCTRSKKGFSKVYGSASILSF